MKEEIDVYNISFTLCALEAIIYVKLAAMFVPKFCSKEMNDGLNSTLLSSPRRHGNFFYRRLCLYVYDNQTRDE